MRFTTEARSHGVENEGERLQRINRGVGGIPCSFGGFLVPASISISSLETLSSPASVYTW